jgi:hypothetical protein
MTRKRKQIPLEPRNMKFWLQWQKRVHLMAERRIRWQMLKLLLHPKKLGAIPAMSAVLAGK